jgi:hypothetical protein
VGYCYYKNSRLEAFRLGPWKLHLKKDRGELYDLREDIGESKDLSADRPEIVSRLRKAADAYDADLKANSRPAWNATGP